MILFCFSYLHIPALFFRGLPGSAFGSISGKSCVSTTCVPLVQLLKEVRCQASGADWFPPPSTFCFAKFFTFNHLLSALPGKLRDGICVRDEGRRRCIRRKASYRGAQEGEIADTFSKEWHVELGNVVDFKKWRTVRVLHLCFQLINNEFSVI